MLFFVKLGSQYHTTSWFQQCLGVCLCSCSLFEICIWRWTVISRLVVSKTRVSLVKKQSIRRLELLGSLILARLINTILTSWSRKIETVYWVDSMSVLFWIRNQKPWKQYVTSRVREIWQLTSREQWRHCPGPLNPADLPSRAWLVKRCWKCIMVGGSIFSLFAWFRMALWSDVCHGWYC